MATQKKIETKTTKKVTASKSNVNAETKPAVKAEAKVEVKVKEPVKAGGKTVYHVSKRENDGREWKVFIQGSTKVIKLFDTQLEALNYAKSLCKNKDDGSYVLLHGLDGKMRKY